MGAAVPPSLHGAPPSLLSDLWYDLGEVLGWLGFNLGFSFRSEGLRHMPQKGPVLVIANHQSYFDPYIVGCAVRRHLTFLARKTLFDNKFFGTLISSLNAVPIDQDGVGKEGIKNIVERLKLGQAVLVFPEGERTGNGEMVPLRPGIHLLMRRCDSMILPVGIAGAFEAFPRSRHFPIPAPLFMPAGKSTMAVSIGKPIDSRRYADMPREQALAELFNEIKKAKDRAERLRRK